MSLIVASIAVLGLALAGLAFIAWRRRARNLVIQALLDDADRMEARLLEARTRMRELEALLGRLPADITENARASLASEAGFQDAMRRVLQHRIWIRDHARSVPIAKLDEVAETMRRSLSQLDQHLMRLEGAGAELRTAYANSDAVMGRGHAEVPAKVNSLAK